MPVRPSPGKYLFEVDRTFEVVRAWLYNFDVGKWSLKKEHSDLLDSAIGPVIQEGGSIKLLGLASTTGTVKRDLELGEKRMLEVQHYLTSNFGSKFTVSKHISLGKEMALAFNREHLKGGTADNKESCLWRAVVINAWNRGFPPPPPLPKDDPFNDPNWSSDISKGLDAAAMALGFIDFVVDVAEVAVAFQFALADAGVSGLAALAALPLAWGSGDFYAQENGKIQGRADAIQDMADQYNDGGLDQKRLADWPSVNPPQPHLQIIPQPSTSERFWRQGQTEGARQAIQVIIDMEQNPRPIELPNGKKFRLTGRIWLRAMSKAFGDNVGIEAVIKPVNEALRKQNKPPFPTHP